MRQSGTSLGRGHDRCGARRASGNAIRYVDRRECCGLRSHKAGHSPSPVARKRAGWRTCAEARSPSRILLRCKGLLCCCAPRPTQPRRAQFEPCAAGTRWGAAMTIVTLRYLWGRGLRSCSGARRRALLAAFGRGRCARKLPPRGTCARGPIHRRWRQRDRRRAAEPRFPSWELTAPDGGGPAPPR
jgi:hypothetical protein